MIRHADIQLALQQRLLTLLVCTTGSTSLSATATGYARASGSFVSDGFAPGMQITSISGFVQSANNATDNPAKVITKVTDLAIDVPGTVVEAAGAGRTLSVGLPSDRAFENITFEPRDGRPYVDEQYVPATSELRGMVIGGTREETGLYVVGFAVPFNNGAIALARYADALLALFPLVLSIPIANGDLRVRGDVGPMRSQVLPLDSGYARVGVSIPWRLLTLNN